MKTLRVALALMLAGAIMALASASPASAATSPRKILSTCEHDNYVLNGTYTLKELKAAYNLIPVANQAYDPCAQVITNKIDQLGGAQHLTGASKSGSSFPWIIVIIVVIVLAGGGGAFWSWRRSQAFGDSDDQG